MLIRIRLNVPYLPKISSMIEEKMTNEKKLLKVLLVSEILNLKVPINAKATPGEPLSKVYFNRGLERNSESK